jgi:Txe/YoeB family toxin of Txe-Axe toxin-antitoxin module
LGGSRSQNSKAHKCFNQGYKKTGPLAGIGKPELLEHRKQYSRRIIQAHWLVYEEGVDGNVVIVSCYGHYDD